MTEDGQPNRRLYETAVFATLRDRLRSGDVWVERSANYRRFDSYLLPPAQVPPIVAKLGLPATADEWLARRGAELDRRLRRFGRRLRRGEMGWNCQINAPADQIVAAQDIFLRVPGRLVFDHLAHVPAVSSPSHQLIRRPLDKGNTWVKLSGAPSACLAAADVRLHFG